MKSNNDAAPTKGERSEAEIKRGADAISFEFMDALHSPILTFSESWADTIPQRIMQIIPMARLAALLQKSKEATDPEVVAYLYPRTLDAPLNSDWCDIYCYLCCKVIEHWFEGDCWEEMCPSRQLNSDQERQLAQLRRFIYEQRRKQLNRKLKANSI